MAAPLQLRSCASLFVFDWDDTCLPTSALDGSAVPPPMLREIDVAVSRLLAAALATPRSRVLVLTNAAECWLWSSAAEHLPSVHAILSSGSVKVLSARRPEADAATWKDASASGLVAELRTAFMRLAPSIVQVICAGDSPHDLRVGQTISSKLRQDLNVEVIVKTVKFPPEPAARELARALQAFCQVFAQLTEVAVPMECYAHGMGVGSVQMHPAPVHSPHKRKVDALPSDEETAHKMRILAQVEPSPAQGGAVLHATSTVAAAA